MNENLTPEEIKQQKRIEGLKARSKKYKQQNKRIPLHKKRRIGLASMDEKFHYRLVNDVGNNLESFVNAGYEFVEDKARGGLKDAADEEQMGRVASQVVDSMGTKGYYMRIPKKIWEEDNVKEQKELDELEKRIGLDKIPDRVRRGKIEIGYDVK